MAAWTTPKPKFLSLISDSMTDSMTFYFPAENPQKSDQWNVSIVRMALYKPCVSKYLPLPTPSWWSQAFRASRRMASVLALHQAHQQARSCGGVGGVYWVYWWWGHGRLWLCHDCSRSWLFHFDCGQRQGGLFFFLYEGLGRGKCCLPVTDFVGWVFFSPFLPASCPHHSQFVRLSWVPLEMRLVTWLMRSSSWSSSLPITRADWAEVNGRVLWTT